MPVLSIGTTSEKLVDANKRRTALTIANNHATAILYISDKPNPTTTKCKWVVWARTSISFNKELGDFPERAYYAISDTASTTVIVGPAYKEK